jgi:hypothetical protein
MWVIALGVISIWSGMLLVTYWVFPTWSVRGQFGDVFGSVNALFSGLAFAGLIYAILLQRTELALQREELKLQREEMRGSREALVEQAVLQKFQLKATVAEMRIRVKQIEVSMIQMESLDTQEPARYDRYGRKIREVASQMEAIIRELQTHIGDVESHDGS